MIASSTDNEYDHAPFTNGEFRKITGLTHLEDVEAHELVLDTAGRISELCFGLFMALSWELCRPPRQEKMPAEMMYTALGCNLARGLADAVLSLVRTLTNRDRRVTIALTVENASDVAAGVSALRDVLSTSMKSL